MFIILFVTGNLHVSSSSIDLPVVEEEEEEVDNRCGEVVAG